MMKYPMIFFLVAPFLLFACSGSQEKKPEITESDLVSRVLKKSLKFKDQYGTDHAYSLSIPADYKNQKTLPLILYLHGRGGDENSELLSFTHYVDNILSECEVDSPLIVFPSNKNDIYILDHGINLAKGLPEIVAQTYPIEDVSKRIITGFSMGANAAIRTAITQPNHFAASFSWGGGVWSKDVYLFNAAKRNAQALKDNHFKAFIYKGKEDSPRAYNPLLEVFDETNFNYHLSLLDDQKHDLDQYWANTQLSFGKEMCELFSTEPVSN